MPLIAVAIPPGVYKNGTPYAAKNRWAETNRVRWHDGALRPIGGWKRRTDELGEQLPQLGDVATERFRDIFSWSLPSAARHYAIGSNRSLQLLDENNVVKDITPEGFLGSPLEATVNGGYGRGKYGAGPYNGTRQASLTAIATIWRWSFDNWGADLIATSASRGWRGPVYSYSSGSDRAEVIPNSPAAVSGVIVTDQRHVMVIGSAAEPRLVQWSDVENREEWTPTESNQAGFQVLQGTGHLVSINKVQNVNLILSESDAHIARFIGSPFVFGFDRVGTGCGPLSAGSVIATDRFAMWLGRRNFWMYDGTVTSVPSPIMDFLVDDIDPTSYDRIHTTVISQFNELWWFYQSTGGSDVDSYVAFDYNNGQWMHGRLSRTCAVDGTSAFLPVMVSDQNYIYNHENRNVCVKDTYAATGPLELGTGDNNMAVRYIYPDTETTDNVTYSLIGATMPTAKEFTYGPYQFANPIATRAIGRQLRLRVDGDDGKTWKAGGATRFDVAPANTGQR